MLEFLVLGKLPGTQTQIDITAVVYILGSLLVAILGYLLFRVRVRKAIKSVKSAILDHDLIAL